MKRILSAVAILIALFSAGTALAGNEKAFFLGNDASMTAGSLAAVVRDSESIWYNPAGMGGNDYTRLDLSGNVFMLRLQNIPNGMRLILPSGTYDRSISGNEYLAVPAAITFMRKGTENLSYGFGVFMPQYRDVTFQNSFTSPENFPTIAESVTYTQGFDYDVLDTEYDIGGAVGWQADDEFRVGGALFILYDRSRINRDQFESIESADGSGTTSLFYVDNFRALIRNLAIRGTAGLQWQPSEEWSLGLVAFSPAFQLYTWGDVSANAAGTSINAQGQQTSQAVRTTENLSDNSGKMVEPFHAQISVGYTKPDYWIGLAADFYLPLKEPRYYIDKKFNWNVCAGSKFRISEKLNMGAGFFTDMSDTRNPGELGEARVNYYGLTFGTEFRTPISRNESGDKPPIVFSSTFALRYALGLGDVGGQVFNAATDGNISNAQIRSVDVIFHEISVYVGTSLFF